MRRNSNLKQIPKKALVSVSTIFLVVTIDQLTKLFVLKSSIWYACNLGFAFGLLPGFLNVLSAFLMLSALVYLFLASENLSLQSGHALEAAKRRKRKPRSSGRGNLFLKQKEFVFYAPFALIIGGGIANLADRVFKGCVVDFIRVPLWPTTFNLADLAITVGVLLMIFSVYRDFFKKE